MLFSFALKFSVANNNIYRNELVSIDDVGIVLQALGRKAITN